MHGGVSANGGHLQRLPRLEQEAATQTKNWTRVLILFLCVHRKYVVKMTMNLMK